MRRSKRRPRDSAGSAERRETRTRASVRVAARSFEGNEDTEKHATTEDTVDTEVFQSIPLRPLCPLWWRVRVRAIPDARPETNGGHSASRDGSARRQHFRPSHSRTALEQHRKSPR